MSFERNKIFEKLTVKIIKMAFSIEQITPKNIHHFIFISFQFVFNVCQEIMLDQSASGIFCKFLQLNKNK